jgi:hypothetical protein
MGRTTKPLVTEDFNVVILNSIQDQQAKQEAAAIRAGVFLPSFMVVATRQRF